MEFNAPQTIDGLRDVVGIAIPAQARAVNMSAYGRFALTLEMPPATQVIPPQLVDLSGTVE